MVQLEYTLVALIEPMAIGTEFISWPLHITIVPWFRGPTELVQSAIESVTMAQSPIKVVTTAEAHFGSNRDILVRLIEPTRDLQQLHWRLLVAVEQHGFLVVSKQFCGDNFVPHLTKRGAKTIPESTTLSIDSVYLVRAPIQERPTERTKRVLQQFSLAA